MKRGKKGLIVGGSTIAIILVTILILAVLPPGNLSLMDDYRDRDSDGLTDAEELVLGTNPERSDTDGDGLQDNEEGCPNGDSDWTASAATDYDSDGCRDNGEDSDDDNDGILDGDDDCRKGRRFTSVSATDWDGDGCRDWDEDDDDDNDGWSDQDELDCNSNPNSANTMPEDLDGDMICDLMDPDDDGDGANDDMDAFPRDWTEWSDFDEDGTGDNADTDDDNDGTLDIYDANDYADVGIKLSFDSFRVITQMDYFDDYAEVYICMYVEGQIIGCGPDETGYYWSMQTSYVYDLDTELFVDLPEENSTHLIQLCAWDQDYSENDRIDISPLSSNNCYGFYFGATDTGTVYEEIASGTGDSTGYDGELGFSYQFVDLRTQRFNEFNWDYNGQDFEITLNLDYDTYSYFKKLDHYAGGVYHPESYGVYATPSEQYVINIANQLKDLAFTHGIYSELGIAEFVYAFVGDIQYVLDTEGSNVSDYPKYPIEMLWESSGDCEDAAILYISLIEALGYDAMIATGFVKTHSDGEWLGHAWALLHLTEPPPGWEKGWYGTGNKDDMVFYFVEATGYNDGSSFIGRDAWFDYQDVSLYDVE
jgi:hypothetical protein